jgi:hypothetical protein
MHLSHGLAILFLQLTCRSHAALGSCSCHSELIVEVACWPGRWRSSHAADTQFMYIYSTCSRHFELLVEVAFRLSSESRPTLAGLLLRSLSLLAMVEPRPTLGAPSNSYVSSEAAFGESNRALKILPHWLELILSGAKRLEIRGNTCPHLGCWITLAEVGSGRFLGRAFVSDSRKLSDADRQEHAEAILTLDYQEMWGWELQDVERFPVAIEVPFIVRFGTVTWVTRERWEAWETGLLVEKVKKRPAAVEWA